MPYSTFNALVLSDSSISSTSTNSFSTKQVFESMVFISARKRINNEKGYPTVSEEFKQKTSTAAVDPWHLKVEVADQDFPNCSYVINRTCQDRMLIM